MGFKKDLPLTSSHWGTYRAKVNNGKVTELIGWENDKDPSPIGPGIVDIHDNKTRIDKPMIRKSWIDNGPGTNNNLRGIDPFVAVSWNEAENIVAKELNRVRENSIQGDKKIVDLFTSLGVSSVFKHESLLLTKSEKKTFPKRTISYP